MLNKVIQEACNKQLNAELFSAYLYMSMAAHFESKNLTGMAQWMKVQAHEELGHSTRFYDFINARGGNVELGPIEGPKTHWDSPLDVFRDAYNHECKVTGMINELVKIAAGENDNATGVFLQWFVTEQVEEEASVDTVVKKLELSGDNGPAILMLDGQLGQRAVTPDVQNADV